MVGLWCLIPSRSWARQEMLFGFGDGSNSCEGIIVDGICQPFNKEYVCRAATDPTSSPVYSPTIAPTLSPTLSSEPSSVPTLGPSLARSLPRAVVDPVACPNVSSLNQLRAVLREHAVPRAVRQPLVQFVRKSLGKPWTVVLPDARSLVQP